MTRIISGFAGSRTLKTPGAGTRPTSDRLREAIFSALESRDELTGARVLDLYAGSGALGLEAASRGALHVTLVDNLSAAVRACRDNAAVVLKGAPATLKVDVTAQTVKSFLGTTSATWDVIFIDPPYDQPESELEEALQMLAPRVSPHATICVERSSRSPHPSLPAELTLERHKNYGDTTLYWLIPTIP